MKILEVAWEGDIGSGHMGPVTNVVFQLTRKFAELGHEVTLSTGISSTERRLLPASVRVLECASATSLWSNAESRRKSRLSMRLQNNSQYSYMKELASRVDLASFDIVHTHQLSHAAILQREFKQDCVYTIHTPQVWCDQSLYRGAKGVARRIVRTLKTATGCHEINVIREAWLPVALGEFVRGEVSQAEIAVVPNGIDLDEWPTIAKGVARRELGFGENEFLIIFAASIRPSKGLSVLLQAVEVLAKKGIPLKLVVLGHCPKDVEDSARDLPVDLRGFVSNRSHEFRAYLSAADLMVTPSLSDNQPTVVLEALAMGLPVVASCVGAVPDMINEKVGLLFEPGNWMQLADRIEGLRGDPNRCRLLAQQCRHRVETHFTWEHCAESYLSAVRSRRARARTF